LFCKRIQFQKNFRNKREACFRFKQKSFENIFIVRKYLDRQALGVIRLTLSRNVAFNIAKEKITASLMAALCNMYKKPSASNKVQLMRRLFNLQMTEDASVAKHLNALNTVTTQLSSVGIEFDEEVRALIFLSSLSESWNATITVVSSSSGSNKLKYDDVRDLVLGEEIRRQGSGESPTSSVLHTESRRGNGHRRSNNHKQERILGDRFWSVFTPLQRKRTSIVMSGETMGMYTLEMINHGKWLGRLNGSAWKLRDVGYIPDLRKNLISVGRLADGGYTIIFHVDNWKVLKGAMIVDGGKKSGTLYIT
ncbi:hypothetical protein V2J09_013949, partial [Rumex salicifolius]